MDYSNVASSPEAESIKWGIRWLYRKKSSWSYDPATNRVYSPQWANWSTAVYRYGDQSSTYESDVMNLYNFGKNPHVGDPTYLWPIKTNGYPRD